MIRSFRPKLVAGAVAGLAAAAVCPARAQVLVDTGRGSLLDNGGSNGNIQLGDYRAGENILPEEIRDHFDFSIPTINGTLVSAVLELSQPSIGSTGGHVGPATTFSVFSLGAFGSYAFSDIGTGSLYGSVGLDSTSNGTTVDINLDAAALADIIAAQGGSFSLGGVDSGELTTGANNYDFGDTAKVERQPGGVSELVLTVQPPAGTPEPGSVALLVGMGASACAVWRRRRLS